MRQKIRIDASRLPRCQTAANSFHNTAGYSSRASNILLLNKISIYSGFRTSNKRCGWRSPIVENDAEGVNDDSSSHLASRGWPLASASFINI